MERHRKLVRSQGHLLDSGAGRHALEAGPLNRRVFGEYLRARGWRYTSIDQSHRGNPADPRDVSFVDLEVDLCALAPFADGAVQLFIAQHVIEEIVEYRRALAEIARVLRGGGTALLEIPFDPTRRESQSQPPGGLRQRVALRVRAARRRARILRQRWMCSPIARAATGDNCSSAAPTHWSRSEVRRCRPRQSHRARERSRGHPRLVGQARAPAHDRGLLAPSARCGRGSAWSCA